MPPARKRSIVYIDGFNLYYGAIKGSRYKWLNLERYFAMLRPDDDIQVIRYFTAMIDGPHARNQVAYLNALSTLPIVEVTLGQFKNKQIECRVRACRLPRGRRFFRAREEKRTDVSIAIAMLDDAVNEKCERQILVSGDSDLVPAINMVKRRFPEMEIAVYVPARDDERGAAVELRCAADKNRTLPLNILGPAQFPVKIPDGIGGSIEKPVSW